MSKPAPLSVPLNPSESRAEYLLRCAAAYISAYAPEKPITYDDACDDMIAGDGETLRRDLLSQAEELEETRHEQARSIEFYGKVVEAGNDEKGQPSMTIHTTAEHLRDCGAIPFYLSAAITITPLKR